jgi:hypothetical protein
MKIIPVVLITGFTFLACESGVVIVKPDPGNSSSSSGEASTSSSSPSSSASSSGQGNGGSGGNGSGLPCDPCMNKDGSRVVVRHNKTTGPDGIVFIQDSGLYDTVLKLPCYAQTADDGSTRCMPLFSVFVGSYFSDPNCSTNVVAYIEPTCGNPPKYAGEPIPSQACNDPTKYAVYEIGAEFVGQLYVKNNGTCIAGQPSPIYKYYSVGNKVSPSDFAEVNVQTVP